MHWNDLDNRSALEMDNFLDSVVTNWNTSRIRDNRCKEWCSISLCPHGTPTTLVVGTFIREVCQENVAFINRRTNGGLKQVRSWPLYISKLHFHLFLWNLSNTLQYSHCFSNRNFSFLFLPSGSGCFLDCNYLAVIIKLTIYYLLANKLLLPGLSLSSGPVLSERQLAPHYSSHRSEVC